MVDALRAWWAQQLVLCDWAFTPHPLALDAGAAEQQLLQQGITHRGELAEQLLEAAGAPSEQADQLLGALEWAALAGAAGWLEKPQAEAWAQCVIARIAHEFSDFRAWLSACRQALSASGWQSGADDCFVDAYQALATLEAEEEGVTWEQMRLALGDSPKAPLWPEQPEAQSYRLCALLRPVISYPASAADWPDAGTWLAKVWQIHDRAALLTAMLWLSAQGERQRWDIDARQLIEMDRAQRDEWQRSVLPESPHAVVLATFVSQGEPLEWAAWDWLRLAELAWAGVCCGYLSQQEADHFAAHAAELVSLRYHDWQAVLASYVRGLSLFDGMDRRAATPLKRQHVLLHSTHSPWRVAIAELLDDSTRHASHAALLEWRGSAYHWLLALVGVREPDAMLRQGNAFVALPEARRMEAAHFLQETLGFHADEGAVAMGRYWLPAQAHHLNQLAADAAYNVWPPQQTPFGQPAPEFLQERQPLKNASRHAATIHMAEKFAFYLHMALDSQLFEHDALMDYASALQSSLCRFYPHAKSLLNAWLAWERCLPEPEHESLAHEIAWHLEDPGSLFHWLDWRPGEWREPGPRPSLTHFTAMALAGPLNSAAWSQPQPESPREKSEIAEWVESHYQLHQADELKDFVNYMLDAGDRQEYQINYAPYTLNWQRLEEEIAIIETGECGVEERQHLARLERVRHNEDGCNTLDMAAWDIAQAVDLAIAGRQLEWLTQAQFAQVLDRVYALAAKHYSGWQAYAEGMYAGFSFFMGETPERESFLAGLRQALVAWLCAAPLLAGPWASLDFPGNKPRHFAPLHIDTLPGDRRTLH